MGWQWQWLHRTFILQAVTRRHQLSMVDERNDSFSENMPIFLCHSDCYTLTTVHFETRYTWDYQGIIMDTRRFARHLLTVIIELKHFISQACHCIGEIQSLVLLLPLSSPSCICLWSFMLPCSTDTSMQWWMLFITKGWNGKWSKMSALGSNPWLGHILSSARASETCVYPLPHVSLKIPHGYSYSAVCTTLWNLI